ncbi:MAG TPA: hypothetical protein V6C81_02150 [Planktothrix sp.]
MDIVSDKPLKSTCCVCGTPVGLLGGLPSPLGGVTSKCKSCGNVVCSKHYSGSRKQCVQCAEGRSDWCKTPPIPPLGPIS